MGGGQKKTETQQTVAQDINPTFKPYYEDLAKRAQAAQGSVSNQAYGGQFVAPATPLERQGVETIGNAANWALPQFQNFANLAAGNAANYTGVGGEVSDLGRRTIAGEFLDPNNPVLTNAIKGAVNPLEDALNRNIQRYESTASARGASGNSRVDDVKNRMQTDFTRAAGDVSAGITNNWYNRERQLQQQAPALINQGVSLEGAPAGIVGQSLAPMVNTGQVQGQAGTVERSLNQLDVQQMLMQFQDQNTAPYRGLDMYGQLLGVIPSTTTTNSTGITTASGGNNPIMNALQGAAGGASIGSAFGPWGTAIGALAGGALGGFGG